MNELSAARRRSLVEEAAERLYRAIITGQLKQGERIDECQVANLLQISRGPLREALAGLTERGLVVKVAHRGTFVSKLNRDDIDDICSLRAVLEQFAVNRIVLHSEPIDVSPMVELAERMGPASRQSDAAAAIAELDIEFHATLVATAGHRWLTSAWNNLSPQIHMLLYQTYTLDEQFQRGAGKEHHRLLGALANRCVECARTALNESLSYTHERLRAAYCAPENGANGIDPMPGGATTSLPSWAVVE